MTTSQLYPTGVDPRTLQRQVWDTDSARSIPGVGRALDLIGGLASQMPIDDYRGIQPLPRPRLLEQPDLTLARSTFVRLHMDDFLVHGNACHLVTARGADGWPASTRWYPAHEWYVLIDGGRRRYWLRGIEVDPDDVVHVQNGADRLNPARGVGILERYVKSLDRVALQDERQRSDTAQGFVPSVAVIAPEGDDSTDEELDEQAEKFERKFDARFGGRRPAIFPYGTTVESLAWSPNDAQANEARGASLVDVANMFNLDGYWLGAPASSHTYRTPGAMFLVLLRTTVNPILAPFEDVWSQKWLVRGQRVTFQRAEVLADDLKTTIDTLVKATGNKPVMTQNEARSTLKLAPTPDGDELDTTPATPVADDEPPKQDPEEHDDPIDPEETP